MKECVNVACHLRKTPGGYEAAVGDVVTLFAEHYDSRAQGLQTDYWSNDSDFSFNFAAHPKKGRNAAMSECDVRGQGNHPVS